MGKLFIALNHPSFLKMEKELIFVMGNCIHFQNYDSSVAFNEFINFMVLH